MAYVSCNMWKNQQLGSLPRIGTSCVWDTNERFDAYNQLVDVFKFSGRLKSPFAGSKPESYACWSYIDGDNIFAARSFQDVYNLGTGMLSNWNGLGYITTPNKQDRINHFVHNEPVAAKARNYFANLDHPYKTEAGVKMCKALPNCKNQCWNCHLCEDTYGIEHFDSLAEINRFGHGGYKETGAVPVQIETLNRRR